MDNNEKKEHGFVRMSSETSSEKTKSKNGFSFKTVFVSFIAGILGASLVLGLCLYVPSVKRIFTSSESISNFHL